jgi:hypothetical protein
MDRRDMLKTLGAAAKGVTAGGPQLPLTAIEHPRYS